MDLIPTEEDAEWASELVQTFDKKNNPALPGSEHCNF
jgi:hypothetical protein